MDVHPLKFSPIFKPKVWGGRRLAELLDKPLPPDEMIGESWECADLPSGQSVVAFGPARGRPLEQLVREWGPDLTGRAPLANGRFPLVIKFLDAREPLSIQVHPGEETAARCAAAGAPAPAIKHEAWYVLHAEPDAVIYRGLHPGVTPEQVRAAAGTSDMMNLVRAVPVKAGRTLYCAGGTVHALGAGIVVAEVQTTSDVTYRLYDFERRRPGGDDGLHIDASLAAIDWQSRDTSLPARSHVGGLFTTVTRLVSCPAFEIEKVRFVEGMEQEIPYAEMVIWIVLEGRGAVQYRGGAPVEFRRGDVILLPAALKDGRVRTETACVWLEVTVPVASDLAEFARPGRDELQAAPPSADDVVPLGISVQRPRRR